MEMRVMTVAIDPLTDMPMVILRACKGNLSISIDIGIFEASAITTKLKDVRFDRPGTYNLMQGMIAACGGKVDSVEVYQLTNSRFYAKILLTLHETQSVVVEARPSDAIALALYCHAPILVATSVAEKARHFSMPRTDMCAGLMIDLRRALHKGSSEAEPPEWMEQLLLTPTSKWKM